MHDELLDMLATRMGHFRLESGHHGELWLDLELLCLRPTRVERFARELALRLEPFDPEMVCGPLNEGAFVAIMVATHLDVEFAYTERFDDPAHAGLFPVRYRLPATLRPSVRGKRIAIVNDVINAGSSVRATYADLEACGANVCVIGSLLVLGDSAGSFAADNHIPLESIATLSNRLWVPADCPLCAAHMPLTEASEWVTAMQGHE
ncbi:MAG TPA: phosphoribosyltransferase family protein [Chloroflexota bacterium]